MSANHRKTISNLLDRLSLQTDKQYGLRLHDAFCEVYTVTDSEIFLAATTPKKLVSKLSLLCFEVLVPEILEDESEECEEFDLDAFLAE